MARLAGISSGLSPKGKWFCVVLATLFLLASVPVESPIVKEVLGVAEATAQEKAKKKKRRSLFRILFGKRDKKKKAKQKANRAAAAKKRRKKARRSGGDGAGQPKKVAALAKIPNAKVVLVVGDFYASAIASGLEEAFREDTDIRIVNKGKANSGFVRSDIINWPETVPQMVSAEKADYIVVVLGANDRQLMLDEGRKLKKRTPEWDSAYQKRAQALAQAANQTRRPFTWIGIPPVRLGGMNADFLVFNEMYRKAAVDVGGRFIDVWDGFANADGEYVRSGPDVNGQIVLLRSKDGINMTRAGRRRYAFYVENLIRKALNAGKGLASTGLSEFDRFSRTRTSQPTYDPKKTGRTVVIRLNDPQVDGSSELIGADPGKKQLKETVIPTFVPPDTGAVAEKVSKAGRADDFAWPPATALPSAEPVLVRRN